MFIFFELYIAILNKNDTIRKISELPTVSEYDKTNLCFFEKDDIFVCGGMGAYVGAILALNYCFKDFSTNDSVLDTELCEGDDLKTAVYKLDSELFYHN